MDKDYYVYVDPTILSQFPDSFPLSRQTYPSMKRPHRRESQWKEETPSCDRETELKRVGNDRRDTDTDRRI